MYQVKTKMTALILIAILPMLSGCSKDESVFEGSRISNESQFTLEFDFLNTTLTHSIELKENDIVDVVIVKDQGELFLSVADSDDQTVYKGDNASSGEFSIHITHMGSYEFKVSGEKASGLVSFVIRP